MSLLRLNISQYFIKLLNNEHLITPVRYFTPSALRFADPTPREIVEAERKSHLKVKAEPVDRTQIIPVETSIQYLSSEAYKSTYGEKLVWEEYRRNHKGAFAPRKTRKTCIRQGVLATGNPCPICRDEYLVLDHRNIHLLKQFISPHSGEILSFTKTGLCQRKHQELMIAVQRAMDCGLITFDVPFRKFNYSEYYSNQQN